MDVLLIFLTTTISFSFWRPSPFPFYLPLITLCIIYPLLVSFLITLFTFSFCFFFLTWCSFIFFSLCHLPHPSLPMSLFILFLHSIFFKTPLSLLVHVLISFLLPSPLSSLSYGPPPNHCICISLFPFPFFLFVDTFPIVPLFTWASQRESPRLKLPFDVFCFIFVFSNKSPSGP